MSTIELMHGNVQTREGSMNVWVNCRKDAASKETTLQDAVKDPRSRVVEPGGMIENTPATKAKGGGGGYWNKRRLECEDGVYLRIYMRRVDKKNSFGGAPAQSLSSMYIRARSTAPLRELRIELPTDTYSTYSCLYFIGRFDIVPISEIGEQKLYMNGETNELQTLDPAHYEAFVKDRVLEPELAPRSKVVSKRVGKKTLKRPSRTRLIRPTKR